MNLVLQIPPAIEPVLKAELKLYLKIDTTDDDDFLDRAIQSAREDVEEFVKLKMIDQTWSMTDCITRGYIDLPFGPFAGISSLTSIKSIDDSTGIKTTLNNYADYYLLEGYSPARFQVFAYPATYEIIFKVGYGATNALIPKTLLNALKMMAGEYYESRQFACSEKMKAILKKYRKVSI